MVTWNSKIEDRVEKQRLENRIVVYRMKDGSRRRYLRPVIKDVDFEELVYWPPNRWASYNSNKPRKYKVVTEEGKEFYATNLTAAVYYARNIRESSEIFYIEGKRSYCDYARVYGGSTVKGESLEKLLQTQEKYSGDIVEVDWENPYKVAECDGKVTEGQYKVILDGGVESFFATPSEAYKKMSDLCDRVEVVKEEVDLDVEYEYKICITTRDQDLVDKICAEHPTAEVHRLIKKIR